MDAAWEAMVEACGYGEEITKTERGRINAALKELRAIYPNSTGYAIGFDIGARASVYKQKFPGMELTPQALVGNWSRLDPSDEPVKIPKLEQEPKEYLSCPTCRGDRMVLTNLRSDGTEEYAPCPDCHPDPLSAGYWRGDGSRHNPPQPGAIRQAMLKLLDEEAS